MTLPPQEPLARHPGGAAVHDGVAGPPRSVWPLRRGGDAPGGDAPLAFLAALAAADAGVVPFALGRREAFLLNDPALVEDVLVRRAALFPKGRGYQHAARLLGSGLLTASGDLHRDRRRLAQGAFHRQRVAALAPAIVRQASRRASSWTAGEPIDVAREMRALTLSIAGEALFGADLASWADEVHDAVSQALSPLDGLLAIVAPPARARRARRKLDAVVDAIVAGRIGTTLGSVASDGASPGRPPSASAPHVGGNGDDLLGMMIDAFAETASAMGDAADAIAAEAQLGTARAQLRDDVLTFLLASHDTLSHALTWTWLLLDAHRDVDDRLSLEIADVLGGRHAEQGDVPRLVYTRAVVAEAVRLFPPAWVIVRRASTACQLGSASVSADAVVIASPFTMHRREAFFERPLRFLPERWLPGGSVERMSPPKLAYLPFGAGPRACIGEGFAWYEATLVLATLAQSWRLTRTTDAPVEGSARITLRPQNEPPMTATPRR